MNAPKHSLLRRGLERRKGGDPTVAARLARYVATFRAKDIPETVTTRAKLLLLDALGIAQRAARSDYAFRMAAGLRAFGQTPECSVIGSTEKMALRDACIMNAALIHGLDYDDTHIASIVHPTASAFACAFGIAEMQAREGRDLLAAYVLGVELLLRIAGTAAGRFNKAGFHPTGLAAHFSCALQAGWLYALNEAQLTNAQGIAGSTASGTQEFLTEGAWNKRLHPGWACMGGLVAARLAQQGFIAIEQPYEGRYGLYKGHLGAASADIDIDRLGSDLGETWQLMEVAIKPYPICHMIHACADVALALRHRHDFTLEEITAVEVLIPEGTVPVIAEPTSKKTRPRTEYEASFSVQYVVASCLAHGRFGFEELELHRLHDTSVLALAKKVSVRIDENSPFPRFFSGGVTIRLKDGRMFSDYEAVNRGAGDRMMSDREILEKFETNAAYGCSRAGIARIVEVVMNLERHTTQELAATLRLT